MGKRIVKGKRGGGRPASGDRSNGGEDKEAERREKQTEGEEDREKDARWAGPF